MEGLAGGYPVDQLDAADLDQAMAVQRIETRGLGIEHNLAHESSQTAASNVAHESAARPRILATTRRMSRTWARA